MKSKHKKEDRKRWQNNVTQKGHTKKRTEKAFPSVSSLKSMIYRDTANLEIFMYFLHSTNNYIYYID